MLVLVLGFGPWMSPAFANTEARPAKQAWAISLDNDFFVPLGTRDRDFTGGLALTFSEAGQSTQWQPFDALLRRLDKSIVAGALAHTIDSRAMEFGFYGFTPEAIEEAAIVTNDRPYAGLVYLSTSRTYTLDNGNGISTAFTLGILGSDFIGSAQNELHRWLGNRPVKGWGNQISEGGELTARYQIAHHHYWHKERTDRRYKTTVFSSVGYLTEVGISLSTRRGLINSPDHHFNPELIAYGERINDAAAMPYYGQENYFWGGVTLKARLYNAFLQGQFRQSVHTLAYNELRPLIAEVWLGYTLTLGQEYKVSYVIRAQSSELKSGAGNRSHLWGGLVFSRSI